jgi:hypothetical protein
MRLLLVLVEPELAQEILQTQEQLTDQIQYFLLLPPQVVEKVVIDMVTLAALVALEGVQ